MCRQCSGRGVRRIDSEYLNIIDCLKDLFDLRPTSEVEQALSTRTHKRNGRVAFAWLNGAQDIDTRHDSAVVVGCPTHERKDAVCCERDDAMLSIDHVLLDGTAEADPIFDPHFDPCQLDMSELAHAMFHALLRFAVVPPSGCCRGARMSAAGPLGGARRAAFRFVLVTHVLCSRRRYAHPCACSGILPLNVGLVIWSNQRRWSPGAAGISLRLAGNTVPAPGSVVELLAPRSAQALRSSSA